MARVELSCFRNMLVLLAVCGLVLAGSSTAGAADFPQRAAQMLQSIVATTEYLFA